MSMPDTGDDDLSVVVCGVRKARTEVKKPG